MAYKENVLQAGANTRRERHREWHVIAVVNSRERRWGTCSKRYIIHSI